MKDRPAEEAVVRRMCDVIRHRGPDDDGIYVDRGCGIGMRRLSIIDLSTGHQPISNEDGSPGRRPTAPLGDWKDSKNRCRI